MAPPSAMLAARSKVAVSLAGNVGANHVARTISNLLFARKDCVSSDSIDTCEKPVASSHIILAVVLSIGLFFLVSIILILTWLHMRRKARDRKEEELDPFELAAYGIEPVPAKTERSRRYWPGHMSQPAEEVTMDRGKRESIQALTRN